MIGRSALWVARQHGHSIATMLSAYAAWTEGANEADIETIRRAIATESASPQAETSSQLIRPEPSRSLVRAFEVEAKPRISPVRASFASSAHRPSAKCSKRLGKD